MTLLFVEAAQRKQSRLPVSFVLPINWQRVIAAVLVAILVCTLHCLLFFWYGSRPAPEPFSEAQPLPMMDIALEAPTAGAMAEVKPVETKPTPPKPKAKTQKKPKPKPFKEKLKSEIKKPVTKPEEQAAEPESQANASPILDPSNRKAVAGTKVNSTSQKSQVSSNTPARAFAGYLNNPKPHYPGIARNRHWEGLVYLRVYVTADGRCGNLNLQRSSGHDVLDESAIEAVRKWKFVPGKQGGSPVASWVTVPIEFYLRD
ncbi:MAG: TonB family protein [Methyloglobulus sp.]|nr:TonB family protein [Methyloglobulus sp.]